MDTNAPPATAEAACALIVSLITDIWGEPEPDYQTSVTADYLINKVGWLAKSVLKTDAPAE
jgi:hypothetical protein